MQQFVSVRVTACRSCGRALIRSFTGRTLWQGWWGAISFFFNWFVLAANLSAWRRLGAIDSPSLSGDFRPEAIPAFGDLEERAAETQQELPKRRSRLRTASFLVLPGFMVIGLVSWGWDSTHHDHEGAHGAPAPAAMVAQEMSVGTFTADDGSSLAVQNASCTGDGAAAAGGGGHTHFRCQLAFTDGNSDEVLVHLLPGDGLFFKSSDPAGP
jgi:hypothetical protein